MKTLQALVIAASITLAAPVFAQNAEQSSSAAAGAMTAGSVVKVNTEQQKVTVKHEPIANLDMPAMTMVFRVTDPSMLSAVKPGDSIQFHAEKINGAITITHVQAAK